jgi:hypothetical protein
MAITQRELRHSSRFQHAVRRSRTASRPWRHAEFATDLLLAALALYVASLLISVLVSSL